MTCFFVDRFESKITPRFLAESAKGIMLWVIESGRKTVAGLKEDENGKTEELLAVLSSLSLSWFLVICACIEFFSEVGNFTERSRFLELCIIRKKLMIYRVFSYAIGERCSGQDEENGPQYWALRHTVHELWWWRRRVIDWSGLISVWEVWVKPLECSRLNAKKENLVVNSVKSGRKIQQKKNRNVVIVQSGKNIDCD